MRGKVVKAVYLIALLVLVIAAVWLMGSEEFDRVRPIEGRGNYLLHPQEQIPREAPDLLIAEDGALYLFYIDTELINVYTAAGEYRYGLQFPDGQNGRSDMTVKDGLLYVDARVSGIYVFEDTELLRFEAQSIHNESYGELEAVFTGEEDHADGGCTYSYVEETNRIIRSGPDGSAVVIQFPQRKFDGVSFVVLAAVMVFAGRFIWEEKYDPNHE